LPLSITPFTAAISRHAYSDLKPENPKSPLQKRPDRSYVPGTMPKYSNKDLHGLLVVDKALGMTSTDVVRRVRRAGGNCKTGHAGTLDPLATGVLVCAIGKGTKSVSWVMKQAKVYEAAIDLSAFTRTDDVEGEREEVAVGRPPSREAMEKVLEGLTGLIEQTPPAYSAVKIDGRSAYKYARKGEQVEIKSRTVRVDSIKINRYAWPHLDLTVRCGQGTYIRSLARQIGEALGTGGYLTALKRTRVGPYTLEHAVRADELPAPLTQEHLLPIPD
jgi:tRNA pseudouridine55 synthase